MFYVIAFIVFLVGSFFSKRIKEMFPVDSSPFLPYFIKKLEKHDCRLIEVKAPKEEDWIGGPFMKPRHDWTPSSYDPLARHPLWRAHFFIVHFEKDSEHFSAWVRVRRSLFWSSPRIYWGEPIEAFQ